MAQEPDDGFKQAYEVYRQAWNAIGRWIGDPPEDSELGFYVEEMKDALLDLKQGVISRDPSRVAESIDEVLSLLVEIGFRYPGDE
jgi:hypothetical protein